MEYRNLSEIDSDIVHLSEVVENVNESTSDSLMDGLFSLYEEKYFTILNKKKELDEMYESGSIDAKEWKEYKESLDAESKDVEDTIYPFMTEAVAAQSVAIIKKEIKELEGRTSKKFQNISGLKKLSGSKIAWLNARYDAYAKALGINLLSENETEESEEGEKHVWKKNGKEFCSMTLVKKDGKSTIKKSLGNVPSEEKLIYNIMMLSSFLYAGPQTKTLISKMLSFWKKELSNTAKEIKESVLLNTSGTDVFNENVDSAVAHEFLTEEDAMIAKEFVNELYEYSVLQESVDSDIWYL